VFVSLFGFMSLLKVLIGVDVIKGVTVLHMPQRTVGGARVVLDGLYMCNTKLGTAADSHMLGRTQCHTWLVI
jgi:hypothetical protein